MIYVFGKLKKLNSKLRTKIKRHLKIKRKTNQGNLQYANKNPNWMSLRRFDTILSWIYNANGKGVTKKNSKLKVNLARSTTKNIAGNTMGLQSVGANIQKKDGLIRTGMYGLGYLVSFIRLPSIDILWKKSLVGPLLQRLRVYITSTVSEMTIALKTWSYGLALSGMDRGRKTWSARTVERHIVLHRALLATSIFVIVVLGSGLAFTVKDSNRSKSTLQHNKQTLKERTYELKAVQAEKATTQNKLEEKVKREAQLQAEIDNLNKQLQAKAEAKRQSLIAKAASPFRPAAASAASSGCVSGYSTGNSALNQIISRESGGNSCATNAGGCFGLLQACPGAPLRQACGGNPSCQIAWFQANKTGGRSWETIWALWQRQGWW